MSEHIYYYTCEEQPDGSGMENGAGWYFWDEVGYYCYGPYDTEEEAKEELTEYCAKELGIDIPSSDGVEDA